jgi:iron complex outermembrane receptor protein
MGISVKSLHRASLLVCSLLSMAGGAALGDPADQGAGNRAASERGDALEEIVVTAEKRTSTVQDTPISMTALSGELLQQ